MRKTAATVALALALILPGSALAATVDSTVTETLKINASLVVSGVPASVSYPDSIAGQDVSAQTIPLSVTTNAPLGWTASIVNASDFTSANGTIAKANRHWTRSCPTPTSGLSCVAGTTDIPQATLDGNPFVLTTSPNATAIVVGLTPNLAIPADAVPSDYTGSFVVRVVTN